MKKMGKVSRTGPQLHSAEPPDVVLGNTTPCRALVWLQIRLNTLYTRKNTNESGTDMQDVMEKDTQAKVRMKKQKDANRKCEGIKDSTRGQSSLQEEKLLNIGAGMIQIHVLPSRQNPDVPRHCCSSGESGSAFRHSSSDGEYKARFRRQK